MSEVKLSETVQPKDSETFIEGEVISRSDLQHTEWRWVLLFLVSFIGFGNYFVYDNPSALQTQIQDKLSIDTFEFSLLYSVYSFPNIILPLLAGIFIDYVGVRAGVLLFTALICVGQLIFVLGCSSNLFWLALFGRAIFGLGGESQNVVQGVVITNWFITKEFTLAIGGSVTVGRLGSVANYFIEPALYEASGSINLGLWVGVGLCGLSLVAGVMMNLLYKHRDRLLEEESNVRLDTVNRMKLSEIFRFSPIFWLISVNGVLIYVSIITFNNFAGQFYQNRFGFSTFGSDMVISITYGLGLIFCPIFGILVDRVGCRAYFTLISAVLTLLTHSLFIAIPDCSDGCLYSVLPLVFLGLSYGLYAAVLWASIPLVVKLEAVGTALGMTSSLQNIGLSVAPVILGLVVDSSSEGKSNYLYASVFLLIISIGSVLSSIWLLCEDNDTGDRLNRRFVEVEGFSKPQEGEEGEEGEEERLTGGELTL